MTKFISFLKAQKKVILLTSLVAVTFYYLLVLLAAHTIYHDHRNRLSNIMEPLFPYPVAIVNRQVITLKRFRLEINARQTWANQHSLPFNQQDTEKQVMQQLVNRTLYQATLKAHNITITDTDVQAQLDKIYNQSGGQAKFQAFLKQNYGSEVDIPQFTQWTRELLAESGVQYQLLTQATVRHILFAVPSDANSDQAEKIRLKAVEVQNQIADVSKFADFAKQYSEDEASRDNGGQLGTTGRSNDLPVYSTDFENALFTLPVGQVSAPVRSQYGWHLILIEKRTGSIDESLAKYTTELRQQYQVHVWLGF